MYDDIQSKSIVFLLADMMATGLPSKLKKPPFATATRSELPFFTPKSFPRFVEAKASACS